MEFKKYVVWAVAGLSAVAVGCSFGGSSSRGGFVAGPATNSGAITSALPTTDTRAANYDFASFYEPTTTPGAYFAEMEVLGTDVLVADAPFSNLDRVSDQGSGLNEVTFFYDAQNVTTVNGVVFAATANRQAPGAGDLWERSPTGSWTLRLDSGNSEMVVAQGATGTWVAHGTQGEGNQATVEFDDGLTGFQGIAVLDSSVPTYAFEFNGELWVGAANSSDEGGQAKLWRGTTVSTNFTEETALPLSGVGPGVRQQVTDMSTVSAVISGSGTVDFLVVAVSSFSLNTGQALYGEIVITDGAGVYEVIGTFPGSAVNSVVYTDDTFYAGLSDGSVRFRDNVTSAWTAEEDLSGLDSVNALAIDLSGDMLIAGSTSAGAAIYKRTIGSGGPAPTNLYYVDDIAPLLAANCASCHADVLNTAANGVFAIASPADDAPDNTVVQTKLDLGTPTNSLLLLEASNDSAAGGHGGGELWATTSASYSTVSTWIGQGAPFQAAAPPPPALTNFQDLHTFLQADCMGCHGTASGRLWQVSASLDASYNSTVAQVTAPAETSAILRKPSLDGVTHSGGLVNGYAKNVGVKYNLILKWIADGTLKQ